MSDEQLRDILRADASKPEGEESDLELILYVMEVLAERRNKRSEGVSPEKALESFKRDYAPETETSSISESTVISPKRSVRWKRTLIAVAAVLIIAIGLSLTAGAFGFDIWGTIAQWTKDTFYFGVAGQPDSPSEPDSQNSSPYAQMQEVLERYGVEQTLVPTWIPDGYACTDVFVQETPKQCLFVATYTSGDKMIKLWITEHLGTNPTQIEQSDSLLEVYNVHNSSFYIFNNQDLLQAAWINERFECYISGPLTLSEIKDMIDSIEKG